ncbi:hypothetical protein V6N13_065612 [Hibiscus sabdariffa]|uniref:F-box protein n=1 Tax=Hibiscus sabdariffa TaxID=183260 RepID=A0ABR2QQD1_9ROSI
MANPKDPSKSSFPFSDIPEYIQLSILSLLSPPDIAYFASTSKRFVFLCRNDTKLWFNMCHRRWGSKTHISKWGGGNITYKLLYKTLTHWENLIGFWRHCGQADLSITAQDSSFSSGAHGLSPAPGSTTPARLPNHRFFGWGYPQTSKS